MTLEEIRKEVIKDFTETKKLDIHKGFGKEYTSSAASLFSAIVIQYTKVDNLFVKLMRKQILKSELRYNQFIKSITKDDYRYIVSTVAGDFVFYDAHKLYDNNKYPKSIQENIGNVYSTAIITCLSMEETDRDLKPMMHVGWAYPVVNDEAMKPQIFAMPSFVDKDKKRYVINYGLDLVMSEDFYKKFMNWETINDLTAEDLKRITFLQNAIADSTKINSDNMLWDYAFMAPTDFEKYVFEVLKDERTDNFEFVGIDNYKEYLKKHKSKTQKTEQQVETGATKTL